MLFGTNSHWKKSVVAQWLLPLLVTIRFALLSSCSQNAGVKAEVAAEQQVVSNCCAEDNKKKFLYSHGLFSFLCAAENGHYQRKHDKSTGSLSEDAELIAFHEGQSHACKAAGAQHLADDRGEKHGCKEDEACADTFI